MDLFENKEKSKALYPTLPEQSLEYGQLISAELNNFLDGQEWYANATVYRINRTSPLMMIKITFSENREEITSSTEEVDAELKKIDQSLWEKKSQNIYFRKKINYTIGNETYIIRPNQRRFWSNSMALEDASELIIEMLNGVHDAT